jgi:diguanylate cyclase
VKNRPEPDALTPAPQGVPALQSASAELLHQLQRELTRTRAELVLARAELQQVHAREQQAQHQAQHDSLTALPNRRCFVERLDLDLLQCRLVPPARAASGAGPVQPCLAVLYLDLDGLKSINDQHGHEAGDGLLRIVATRLARAVRGGDLVCRMGGDEFACLVSGALNQQQLSHLACKLFDAVSAPLRLGLLDLTVRPSIGIALCQPLGDSTDALLRRADAAMYRAKRQQLGYAFYDGQFDA